MQYLVFWEFKPEDMDSLINKQKQSFADIEKAPEKYVKPLFLPHILLGTVPPLTEKYRGFTILEADTEEKLIDYFERYLPETRASLVPITPAAKHIEAAQKFNPDPSGSK